MPDLPTRLDFFTIGADDVLARSSVRPPGQRISPDEAYTEGSDINIILASAAAMADEVTRQVAVRMNALFLDGAVGEDLDRLVADRFSPTIVRKQASPALVTLTFTRTSGPLLAVSLPTGTKVKTSAGVEFSLLAPVSIPAGSTGPVTGSGQAMLAGIQGNVAAGALSLFSSPPPDAALQVTNVEAASGGDAIEIDARLRARARGFFLTARRGTLAAIEFGALTVPGVRQAVAVEESDSYGIPTGRVTLFIADALGQGNAALASAVTLALVEYRAAGVFVEVFGAVPIYVPVTLALLFVAGIDTTAAFASVQAGILTAVNGLRPGATLETSLLFAVARSVPGVIVLADAIVAPVGDLVPLPGQVIRTRISLITAV